MENQVEVKHSQPDEKKGALTTRAISTSMRRFRKRLVAILKSEVFKRCLEVGIFIAAFLSFLANAAVAVLQHQANKIYRGQEQIYQQQTTIASDVEQRSLRAYVSFQPVGALIDEKGALTVTFKVANDGQTPATIDSLWSGMDILPFPLGKKINFRLLPGSGFHSLIIPPHGSQQANVSFPRLISAQQYASIFSQDTTRFYVFGNVEYRDVFGFVRKFQFCASIIGRIELQQLTIANPPNGVAGLNLNMFEIDALNNFEY